jgi:hypothetical protein
MKKIFCTLLVVSATFSSCAMPALKPNADRVSVKASAPAACKELGPVNSGWTGWGTSTENLNSMRNQTAEKGGNVLVPTGDSIGFAYLCEGETLVSLK